MRCDRSPRRCLCWLLVTVALGVVSTAHAQNEREATLASLSTVPPTVRGATIVGTDAGLLLIDGAESPAVHRLADDQTWQAWLPLPRPVENATAVAGGGGASLAYLVGGVSGGEVSPTVLAIRRDDAGDLFVTELPPLPQPRRVPAACLTGANLIVAGGFDAAGEFSPVAWRIDLAEGDPNWQRLPPLPSEASSVTLVTQGDGLRDAVHAFAGIDGNVVILTLDDDRTGWTRRQVLEAASPREAAPLGTGHIILFTEAGSADASQAWVYHTITGTLTPLAIDGRLGVVEGATRRDGQTWLLQDLEGRTTVSSLRIEPPKGSFGWLDYIVLFAYLGLLVAIGLWFYRGGKTSQDFFLAGKRIPWWAAALSLMATQVSSIGFIAIPAKTFATDWTYFVGIGTWFVAVPIVNRVFMPFFQRLNVTSAYEYLERRFGLAVRLVAALIFSLMQLGRMAVVLLLPALALSAVTNLNITFCIVLMGVLTTIYTVSGGMEAVVWTDVLQALVLLLGAAICVVVVIFSLDGGIA